MITQLYPKYYTVKEWGRFGYHMQQMLCRKYDCILTDWEPKYKRYLKWLSPENINKGIAKTQRIMDKISKVTSKIDGSKIKIFEGVSKKDYNELVGMPRKDYSFLLGKKSKSRKKKSKSNYSMLMGKPNYKALTG